MMTDALSTSSPSVAEQAEKVRSQLGIWGGGIVAMFSVVSAVFITLGISALRRDAVTPETLWSAAAAFFIAMVMAVIAMLWRCLHSTAETTIQLLEEIVERLPEVPARRT
jgi:hypothetical protein